MRVADTLRRLRAALAARTPRSSAALCLGVSVFVYLAVRIVELDEYPISFLGDEAVQVLDAAYLVDHGLRDEFGDVLPTYMRNGPYLNLGTTVYLQLVPYLAFGYSVVAARAVSVLVTLTGALAVALLLRDVYRVHFWWTGVLLLSIVPAWFLHSRTAFEAGTGCSLYAWFLYLYLRFRTGGAPWTLYASVVVAAAAFYAYSPLKLVVPATALLLVLSDARWLAARWRECVRAAALVALLALPQVRFQLSHPDASVEQLRILGSYAVDPALGLGEKVSRFLDEFGTGLDPGYWYDPDEARELDRHVMAGWGNVWVATLPFAALGLVRALRRVRDAHYRALLLALVAAPLGAATVEIQLPRSLVVVVPLTVLTALGLDSALGVLARRVRPSRVAAAALAALVAVNVWMLSDALRNGPTWFDDYGLGGLQYGGAQVARTASDELAHGAVDEVWIDSSWANAADTVVRFFLPDEPRVRVANTEELLTEPQPRLSRTAFVLTADELRKVEQAPIFETLRVTRTVRLPNGRVGFAVVRLDYSARAGAIFAARRAALRRPVTERLLLDGERVTVTHSRFDVGGVRDLFDGDTFTLARTADAEALELTIEFADPRPVRRLRVVGREMALAVEARALTVGAAAPRRYAGVEPRRREEPAVELALRPESRRVRTLSLRISDPSGPGDGHVHVREVTFEP